LARRPCQLSFALPKHVPIELCSPLQLAMWGCAHPAACELIKQQACRMHFLPTRQRRIIRCAAPQKSGTWLAAAARPGEADRAGCGAGAGVSAHAAHRAPGPQIAQRCCSAVLCSALLCLHRNRRRWPQLAHRHGGKVLLGCSRCTATLRSTQRPSCPRGIEIFQQLTDKPLGTPDADDDGFMSRYLQCCSRAT